MWHQWIDKNEKEVIEIQPQFLSKTFKGYLDFILSFTELKQIFSQKKYYKEWQTMLSAVNGIYLILDTETNKQYIGATYGKEGIWGRWQNYVNTNGHGNNKLLKALVKSDLNYANNFKFTLLMTLPLTLTNKEISVKEQFFKKKIGAQLNLN